MFARGEFVINEISSRIRDEELEKVCGKVNTKA